MAEVSALGALGRLLPSLLLIIGALLVIRWWARRGGMTGHAGVRVTARTGLSRNATVAVVEVDGRRFLVGATDHRVDLIEELDRTEELTELTTGTTPSRALATTDVAGDDHRSTPRTGFIATLQELTVRRPGPDPWRSLRARR